MRFTRRRLLRTAGAAGGCGIAGTAAGLPRASQSDEGTWTTTYDAGRTEYADAATRTDDGFLLAGRSNDDGDTAAYWTLELGPDGERRAATTFELDARGTVDAVMSASDGAVVVGTDLGPEDAVTASWTPWAAKVTRDGVAWTYGKDRDEVEHDYNVGGAARTSGGEYVLVGSLGIRDPDAWTVRLDGTGTAVRERTADLDRPSGFRDAVAVGDGGVVVGGSVGNPRDPTARLVRLAADGTTDWERTYGDSDGPELVDVRSVAVDGDGFALGLTGVSDGDAGPTVATADGDGTLGSTTHLFDSRTTAAEAVTTVDDGYLVGGSFVVADSEHDYWLAAVGSDGGVRWAARYADGGTFGDLTGDGSHALFAGSNGTDAAARRFALGEPPWDPASETAGESPTATDGTDGTAASDDSDPSGETESGDDAADGSNSSGMPGFGVGEAVAGIAGLELLRRRRGD